MRMLHGGAEVYDRQQEEYKGLHEGYENAHAHDRQRCKKKSGQSEQNGQNDFMAHHIAEKTE